MVKNNLLMENENIYILTALNALIDSSQDFNDSLYINNEQRERILRLQNEIREQTIISLKNDQQIKQDQSITDNNNNTKEKKTQSTGVPSPGSQFNAVPILSNCEVLKKLLQTLTMQLANALFRENQDATLLNLIKTYSSSNHYDLLIESLDKFKEYSDHVLEVCNFLKEF